MIYQKKYLLVLFSLFLSFFITKSSFAQRFDTLMMMYNAKYPTERIHLQFDRSTYAPQDDIWFKAYVQNGILPDTLSKSLYVDFSDEKGKVWAHEAYPITPTGSSFGQFKIPDSLQGNLIHVRAYTKWMLNFDSSFLYNKNLTLIQPRVKRYKGKPPVSDPKIYFFPEGGDAIAGLKTRVAFLCEDQYGQPIAVTGSVKDNAGNETAQLKTEHDGMGSFYFLPEAGKKYTASWKDDKGNAHTTALPDIKASGVSLSISPSPNADLFEVSRPDNAPDNLKNLHLVATLHQQVVYMANISLQDKTTVSNSIPVNEVPSGVLQVTIFDNEWNPLAERISCILNKDDIAQAEVGLSKMSFNTRGQNELVVNVPDSLPTDMSVSVTDVSLSADSSNNLLSDMFISSQIKGNIYKPFYYLDTTEKARKDLDLVMLTHGWRKFNWKVVTGKQPLELKNKRDSTYLTLSGKIYGASPAQIAQAGMMLAIVKTKSDTSAQPPILLNLNPDGTFDNPDAIFFDSLNVFYKFAGKHDYLKNSVVNFLPNRLVSPGKVPINENDIVRARTYDTTGLAAGQSMYDRYWAASHFNDTANINTVTVTTKAKSKEEKLDDKYTSGLFKGGQARTFDIEDDPTAQGQMNVLAYLQGRVAGLQISNPMSPNPSLSRRGSAPALFLDEVQQQDASMLTNLSMSDIAMVKVFDPPFIGAFGGGAGGAIAVYTKRGSDATNNDNRPKVPHKEIIAYSALRQFYVPNYLSLAETHDKQDVRQTLYWNPYILTTAQKNEVHLPFFNNDITHGFRIILEGMNAAGQLIHLEKVYQ